MKIGRGMNECKRGRPSRPPPATQWSIVLTLFLLFPQQPSTSDEAQGFGQRHVKVVTSFNKVLTQVTILNKLKPHIHTGYVWLFCSSPTTHLPRAGFEPLVHPCLWLRFQQQVCWMQPGTLMVRQSFLALALAFLSFHLVQQDRAFFTRPNPLIPETRYAKPSPTVGMLDVLVPFSSMSVLLAPKE
jgi:hypothetical protein